ncbi:MAG: hypothetical protein B6V02_04085 [Thermoprotei archaeon ex4572_64]|nr:MAG: hypothetical protein B6V02_04085 [Thermoprotei archaeon ex4572_64]
MNKTYLVGNVPEWILNTLTRLNFQVTSSNVIKESIPVIVGRDYDDIKVHVKTIALTPYVNHRVDLDKLFTIVRYVSRINFRAIILRTAKVLNLYIKCYNIDDMISNISSKVDIEVEKIMLDKILCRFRSSIEVGKLVTLIFLKRGEDMVKLCLGRVCSDGIIVREIIPEEYIMSSDLLILKGDVIDELSMMFKLHNFKVILNHKFSSTN